MESFSQVGPEHPHYYNLMEMFPDICPDYVRKLCLDLEETEEALDEITITLLEGNYERVQKKLSLLELKEVEEKFFMLISLLPEADPEFLKDNIKMLIDKPEEYNQFVERLMDEGNYPSKTEYLKKLELLEKERNYVKNFNMEYFIKAIPNPTEYFANPERNVSFVDKHDYFYAISFLQTQYSFLHIKDIIEIFDNSQCSVINAAKILDLKDTGLCKIATKSFQPTCTNLALLEEIAYVKNKTKIEDYIRVRNERKKRAKQLAQAAGLVSVCECCYLENFSDFELVYCPASHSFCKGCVKKYCEHLYGDGKTDFPCMNIECDQPYSLRILRAVLSPKLFSKWAQKKQSVEMKQAGLEDLVFCPFCEYVTVLSPENKELYCENADCMKKSCRLCKQVSHVPLRCDEVEKKETNNRIFIEEKMSEALIRKCPTCSNPILKDYGCNKMTCTCGTMMCYVCRIQVYNYNHFETYNGIPGCPLHCDQADLHRQDVIIGAHIAKQALGNIDLKDDPSKDI